MTSIRRRVRATLSLFAVTAVIAVGLGATPAGAATRPTVIRFSTAAYHRIEDGSTARITLTRTNPKGQAKVVVTSADGSATAGADYVAVSRTIRFLTGVSTRSFPVTLLDDAVYEGDETLTLSLAPAPGSTSAVQIGTPSTATLTIAEDDPPPRLAISNASGDEGTTLSFTVTLTGSTTVAASVDFEAQEGTADAGDDFAEASGTITFTPGDTSETITVDALDDVDLDPNEIFHVVLSNPTNAVIDDGTGVGTIGDTDVDTDDDELSDDAEAQLGTDPNDPDTDGDGLDDGFEVSIGFDPNERDADNDNQDDFEELFYGTDPNDADTDDDGLDDLYDSFFADPNDPDTDDDGLDDLGEYIAGTDPFDADSDDDGLSDLTEVVNGTDPNDPNDPGSG